MNKPIVKPKIWYMRDVYTDYANKLLASHPTWWGKYDKKVKLKNANIYEKENGKVTERMSWFIWKEVIEIYFHKAKDAIIDGEVLRLGSALGKIRAIRVERDHRHPEVNWAVTYRKSLKDDNGNLILIYYTDDDWCRIAWEKFDMLQNEQAYRFSPAEKNTTTGKGFKGEFSAALMKDQFLKYKYKFHPVINRVKQAVA